MNFIPLGRVSVTELSGQVLERVGTIPRGETSKIETHKASEHENKGNFR